MARGRFFDTRQLENRAKVLLGLLALVWAGCEFEAIGNDPLPPPSLCQDLKPTKLYIDLEPDNAGITPEGILYADQPFDIHWVYHYDGWATGSANDIFPYITRVEIFQDEEVILSVDVDATPVNAGDYGTDTLLMPEGLPSGQYVMRVDLDIDNVVPECVDLVVAINNSMEADLIVEPIPIDDFAGAGQDGPMDPIDDLLGSPDEEPTDSFEDPANTGDGRPTPTRPRLRG